MNARIPEIPNANNEPLIRVAVAAAKLRELCPGVPTLDRATLSSLGRDCSLCAQVRQRPTGVEAVVGQGWPTEKTYTYDVIREAFALHPATRAYVSSIGRAEGCDGL